jgi:transcriptional regulator with XRE-family HTH domain
MGFKENLKAELAFSGMMVKELAALSGVNKHTIDSYLSTHDNTPSAEVAVRIARVLGVTVEYLVTGQKPEAVSGAAVQSAYPEARLIAQITAQMSEKNRKMALAIIKTMKKQEGQPA